MFTNIFNYPLTVFQLVRLSRCYQLFSAHIVLIIEILIYLIFSVFSQKVKINILLKKKTRIVLCKALFLFYLLCLKSHYSLYTKMSYENILNAHKLSFVKTTFCFILYSLSIVFLRVIIPTGLISSLCFYYF